VAVRYGFDTVGAVGPCVEVLKSTGNGAAKLATARRFGDVSPSIPGVEVSFIAHAEGVEAQNEFFGFVFNDWLKEKLEKKEWIPSPKIRVVEVGLESVNSALDELKKGVSCTKLVIKV
jgi:hypothetical protein